MTTPENGTERAGSSRSPDQIQEDIERTRAELGSTVEALAERLDVKAQARKRFAATKQRARAQVHSGNAKPAGVVAAVLVTLAVVIWVRRR
jgi:hypothetical protein